VALRQDDGERFPRLPSSRVQTLVPRLKHDRRPGARQGLVSGAGGALLFTRATRIFDLHDLEMRLDGSHHLAVDREHVLRAGRERDDQIHLGA